MNDHERTNEAMDKLSESLQQRGEFAVELFRTYYVFARVHVEADDEDEAEKFALEKVISSDGVDWSTLRVESTSVESVERVEPVETPQAHELGPWAQEVLQEVRALCELGTITPAELAAAAVRIATDPSMDDYDDSTVGDCADLILDLVRISQSKGQTQ
jgi:hypothetical protein